MTTDLKNGLSDKYIPVKEQNIHLGDVDFWLVFDTNEIKLSTEDLMKTLRSQFEGVNILKVVRYYYLERESEGSYAFVVKSLKNVKGQIK